MKAVFVDVISTVIDKSPRASDWVRLTASVKFDNKHISPHQYWLEIPTLYASDLTTSGDPWLAHLVTLAMTLGEPLRFAMPVDRILVDNYRKVMAIWRSWYPYLYMIPIEADLTDNPVSTQTRKTAAFYSGGVDSSYTVISHDAKVYGDKSESIDELLMINGFEMGAN